MLSWSGRLEYACAAALPQSLAVRKEATASSHRTEKTKGR